MQFNSFLFILCFLPLVLLGYFTLGRVHPVWSKFVLIGASLFFYAYAEPRTLLPLGLSLLVNYIFSKLLESEKLRWRRFFLAVPVCINAALLLYFKYLNFAITNYNALFHTDHALKTLLLPVGISFFTFQQIAYLVSVYRKELLKADLIDYLAYITYFPKLLMGPLMEPVDFVEQLNDLDRKKINWDNLACGVKIFSFGLFKKVMLADTFAAAVAWGYSNLGVATAMDWLLVMLFYTFEIYFDFSGYSDMAIGLGWMFGFHFKENFNYPYISGTIREFWRRWHMSLSGWFLEYLYIPLGGNRKGKFRTVVNKMIVFLCTGIWHGAAINFLFWGVYHGFFLMLEEYIPWIGKKGSAVKSFFQHVYALLVVCIGFVFFRAETMAQGCFWVRKMFTGFGWNAGAMSFALQQMTPVFLVTLAGALIACCPVKKLISEKKWYGPVAYVCSLTGLVICILSLASGTYNPFIYFRF